MRSRPKLNRRQFIGAVGTGVAVTGCAANPSLPDFFPPDVPEMPAESSAPPAQVENSDTGGGIEDSAVLGALYPGLNTKTILLNRTTFGPTAANVADMNRLGYMPYLESQLNYTTINDSHMTPRLAPFPSLNMTPATASLFSYEQSYTDLAAATTVRAIYSKRQLFERIVEFWTDHFNISPFTGGLSSQLKTIDDREVIRRYALGRFRDLLGASAKSPAMLRYLDNDRNRAGRPNENYARELMELHTLGVSGGYVQRDVQELARALTGWTVVPSGPLVNTFQFRPDTHDNGSKQIMGLNLAAGGGITDGERALDYLASHPSTARFIAGKLVAHFVSEDRPAAIVNQAATTFRLTNGDIKATLRTILSDSSMRSATTKVKRPFHLFVDIARRSGVEVLPLNIHYWLSLMGHQPFTWSTPDGYPQQSSYWAPGLLPRWNLLMLIILGQVYSLPISPIGLAQANGASTPDQVAALWDRLFFGGRMAIADKQSILAFIQRQPQDNFRKFNESLALAWSLPAFQSF